MAKWNGNIEVEPELKARLMTAQQLESHLTSSQKRIVQLARDLAVIKSDLTLAPVDWAHKYQRLPAEWETWRREMRGKSRNTRLEREKLMTWRAVLKNELAERELPTKSKQQARAQAVAETLRMNADATGLNELENIYLLIFAKHFLGRLLIAYPGPYPDRTVYSLMDVIAHRALDQAGVSEATVMQYLKETVKPPLRDQIEQEAHFG